MDRVSALKIYYIIIIIITQCSQEQSYRRRKCVSSVNYRIVVIIVRARSIRSKYVMGN